MNLQIIVDTMRCGQDMRQRDQRAGTVELNPINGYVRETVSESCDPRILS